MQLQLWPGEGRVLTSVRQKSLAPTSVAVAKDESLCKSMYLPAEAGRPAGNPPQECLENVDSLKSSFPQNLRLLSAGKRA